MVQEAESSARFPPSWADALTRFIERLPGPAWVTYTTLFLVLLLVTNATGWLDGSLPIGSFDLYLSSLAVYPVVALAAIYYLDAKAVAALETMRPALAVDDHDFELLRYELATMPARPTIVWSLVGLAFALGYIAFGQAGPVAGGGLPVLLLDGLMALIGFPLLAVLFFHTLRQLRLISRIQSQMVWIDVFQLEPLLALSGVTARNGIIIVGLAYVSAATDPSTFALTNPTLLAFVVISILIAIAAFILPLNGIHQRIAEEKERLTVGANRDLQSVLAEISRRARAVDLTDADALNKQLSSLVIQRDVIARIPTWPWEAATLRAFVTAVLLPIALWFVFRALDRLIV